LRAETEETENNALIIEEKLIKQSKLLIKVFLKSKFKKSFELVNLLENNKPNLHH